MASTARLSLRQAVAGRSTLPASGAATSRAWAPSISRTNGQACHTPSPTAPRPFSTLPRLLQAHTHAPAPAHALRPEQEVSAELDAAREAWEARVRGARAKLEGLGYEGRTMWRQELCWGDHDTFQHVNNVNYVRWYESARMRWGQVLAQHIADESRRRDILRGTGVSFILGGINVRYRRPLLYPDTIIIAQTIALPIAEDRFTIQAIAYSVEQDTIASSADQLCVMYDYVKLAKCPIPADLRALMEVQGQRTAARNRK